MNQDTKKILDGTLRVFNEKGIKYQLLINNNQESFDWFWSDEMLEPYSELKEKEIKIFTNKKGTKGTEIK